MRLAVVSGAPHPVRLFQGKTTLWALHPGVAGLSRRINVICMVQLQFVLLKEAVHDYRDKRADLFPPRGGGGQNTTQDPAAPEELLPIRLRGHLATTRWHWRRACHAKLGGAGLFLAKSREESPDPFRSLLNKNKEKSDGFKDGK